MKVAHGRFGVSWMSRVEQPESIIGLRHSLLTTAMPTSIITPCVAAEPPATARRSYHALRASLLQRRLRQHHHSVNRRRCSPQRCGNTIAHCASPSGVASVLCSYMSSRRIIQGYSTAGMRC